MNIQAYPQDKKQKWQVIFEPIEAIKTTMTA
jgi:hypothetical protein